MNSKKLDVIVCPYCGQEYLPCEIFMPNKFLGKVSDISRNIDGHIVSFNGNSMDLNEVYVCDNCNKTFSVNTKVSFKTEETSNNFEEEYVTEINSKIRFKED